jgi:hypothetical protein
MLGLAFSNPLGVSCSIVVIKGFDTVATVIVTGPDPDELDPDEQAVNANEPVDAMASSAIIALRLLRRISTVPPSENPYRTVRRKPRCVSAHRSGG